MRTDLDRWSAEAATFWQKDGVISVTPQDERAGWIRFRATLDEVADLVRNYDYTLDGEQDCPPDHFYKLATKGPRNITACGPICWNFRIAQIVARLYDGKYTYVKEFTSMGRTVGVYRI